MKVMTISMLAVCCLVSLSCSKDDGVTVLKLVPDKTVIEPNGFDAVSFTVEYDGIDVTDMATVYNGDGSAAGLTFATDAEGSYGFYAEYNGERSEMVTIVATSSMPAIPDDPEPENTDFSRKVLLLQFTGTACGVCPYMISALNQLAMSPERDDYVRVACHSYNPDDPAYYSGPLAVAQDVKGYPHVTFDLDRDVVTISNISIAYLLQQSRTNIVTETANRPALAGIAASSSIVDGSVVVSMSVKVAQTGEYKVAAWLLEDNINAEQANPTGVQGNFNTHNDCLRTVNAGEEAGYTFSIPVEDGWDVDNCHLVLLVTAEDGGSFYVNNAAKCEIGGTVAYEYE